MQRSSHTDINKKLREEEKKLNDDKDRYAHEAEKLAQLAAPITDDKYKLEELYAQLAACKHAPDANRLMVEIKKIESSVEMTERALQEQNNTLQDLLSDIEKREKILYPDDAAKQSSSHILDQRHEYAKSPGGSPTRS
jgi:uncharacterized phage infection (PIP) family protein YhgE